MKKLQIITIALTLLISITEVFAQTGGVGINQDGSPPHESAILDLSSTERGLLLPRLTTAQQNNISNPQAGLVIFNTECGVLNFYDGNDWIIATPFSNTATAATSVMAVSFDANWYSSPGATTYYIDVSTTADFQNILPDYDHLEVGDVTTFNVTGLSGNTTYYYRIRVGKCGARSTITSNVISVTTLHYRNCLEIISANPTAVSGNFTIDPAQNGNNILCYCDMDFDGGGWTRLNSALTTLTGGSWSGQTVLASPNQDATCNAKATHTLSTPIINFTEAYALMTRGSTIVQCSNITNGTDGGYFSPPFNGSFTSSSTCGWSDNIWAYNTGNYTTSGLQLNWFFRSGASNQPLVHSTACASAGDNGQFQMQWFVR